MRQQLEALVQRAQNDLDVLAVILFGSTARNERHQDSDLDICLVLQAGGTSPSTMTEKRIAYMADFTLDIQVFQTLPLYIRQRVLKEGRVLFCRDEDALYTLALRTVKDFADFERMYRRYLEEVARVGS